MPTLMTGPRASHKDARAPVDRASPSIPSQGAANAPRRATANRSPRSRRSTRGKRRVTEELAHLRVHNNRNRAHAPVAKRATLNEIGLISCRATSARMKFAPHIPVNSSSNVWCCQCPDFGRSEGMRAGTTPRRTRIMRKEAPSRNRAHCEVTSRLPLVGPQGAACEQNAPTSPDDQVRPRECCARAGRQPLRNGGT